MGVHDGSPDAAVRHYGRRCASRAPPASKRITKNRRSLEVAYLGDSTSATFNTGLSPFILCPRLHCREGAERGACKRLSLF